MIRLPVESPRVTPRHPVSQSSWLTSPEDAEQKVAKWIRKNPGLSLILAVSLGAGLGWLIKTRK